MPIHFRCPHCDKLLAIGTAKGGTQIHCPMCARLLTVPPRTEVKLPTTTVIPPDLAQAWWTDAPPVAPPQPETPPAPPADAWWMTAHPPAVPVETAIPGTAVPRVPPPLPEPLVFEPSAKTPTGTNSANTPSRLFAPLYAWLIVMIVAASLLVATVFFVLLRS